MFLLFVILSISVANCDDFAYLKDILYENQQDDEVVIENQVVSVLPKGILNGVPITKFIMKSNVLREIEPGAFDGAKLSILSVEDNAVEILRKGVLNKKNFKLISLDDNMIQDFEIGALEDVVVDIFSIARNNLIKLTKRLFTKSKIRTLMLGGNQIDHIEPGTFQNIQGLISIDLRSNKIVQIENVFNNLRHLENLNLNNNFIKKLPSESFSGSSIDNLYLVDNQITEIRKDIFQNTRIININLSSNQISHIQPRAFDQVMSLDKIDLSFNSLRVIKNGTFPAIFVELRNNKIISIELAAANKLKIMETTYLFDSLKNNIASLNNNIKVV